jgi:membrane protease YdiL (CAAX protease family)
MSGPFALEPRWRRRIFAFLRVVLFVGLFAAGEFAIAPLIKVLQAFFKTADTQFLVSEAIQAVAILAITALLARISQRRVTDYGLGGQARMRRFLFGIAAGAAFLSGQLLLMHALGLFDFGTARTFSAALMEEAAVYAVTFLAVGLFEETLFRGYALVELSRAISFWPATLAFAALFGLPHAVQAGDNALGGFEAGLFAFAAAASFRWTGSLWFAIGYHAAWDFGESFFYGVPDSGLVTAGRLFHPAFHGPDWLSGGSAGPEGSVFATLPMLAVLGLAWLLRDRTGAAIKT